MKKLGRRMVARLMAGVLTVSLGLAPVDTVKAEEIRSEDMLEAITADHGEGVSEDEKTDALQDEAASVSENEAIGGDENEEDNEPKDEAVKEKPDDGSTEAEEQEEDSVVEETTEDPEEDLQGNLAKEIEESIETIGIDTVSANMVSSDSEDDNIASGVVDEDYGYMTWKIDQNGKLTVTGTGDFAPIGEGYAREAPWLDYSDSVISVEVNVQGMTDATNMFLSCYNLTSVDFRNFDTKNVVNMRGMFSYCYNLTRLDLSDFDTGNVTRMNEMFYECYNLTDLNLSSFNTENVTNINYMFEECSSLVHLDLSSFDLRNLSIEDNTGSNGAVPPTVFGKCKNLITINTPRNLKKEVSLPTGTWYRSDGSKFNDLPLNMSESIEINKNRIHADDIAGGSFRNIIWFIDQNKKLTVKGTGEFAPADEHSAPWWRYTDDIEFAEVDVTGMTDASYMFSLCNKLKSVDFTHFDTGQVTNMRNMFQGCQNLTDLSLGNINTSQVTDMSSMFYECNKLISLDLSGIDTSQVTDMRSMFSYCNNLTSLDLGSFDTSQVTSMEGMFRECQSLTVLDLSGFDLSNIVESGYGEPLHIWECELLNTIYTPRNFPDGISVDLPDGTWYQPDGTVITELPHLDHSIIITKDKVPSAADPHITAAKRKTVYKCGDRLDINDLMVRYYDSDGKVIYVTDYTTNADQIDMSTPGTKSLVVTYNGLTATVELSVSGTSDAKERVEISGIRVQDSIYSGRVVAYGGTANVRTSAGTDVTDKVALTYTYSGKMADGSSYPASGNAPANAGQYTLKVAVSGEDSNYTGSVEYPFAIRPAPVVISVQDCIYTVGEAQIVPDSYEFEITGLLNGDKLTKQPGFSFTDMSGKEISKSSIDLSREGSYYIVPVDADAGINYEITYRKGILSVTEERVAYTVRFELNGHAGDISPIIGVKAGSLIDAPENPIADGYIFKGWYKEPACRNMWDFAKDVVQEDIMLYACWITAVSPGTKGTDLCIQEIQDLFYTGSALKPGISVYSGDGETLLKLGKDYTIKYCNNVDADTAGEAGLGGTSATGQEGDNGFTRNLAYVLITGKGNYTGTVYKNFHINAVSISAEDREGGQTPAPGFTLKYTEQMTVNGSKAQKPFTSLRHKKAMKAGKDYEVMLRAVDAYDEKETVLEKGSIISRSDGAGMLPTVPKGYRGTFLMTVTGMGNYTGSIEKTIYVADKAYLMKNAAVTLGKNQKVIKNPTAADLKKGITLTPAYYDVSDKKYYTVGEDGTVSKVAEPDGSNVFTVKSGKTYLVYGKDYTVNYEGNRAAGNAVMTLIGKGKYAGTKNMKFKIAGIPFNTKNIVVDSASFQPAMPYSGKALTQNKVILYPKDGSAADALVYGVDYTINYKNNISKGTAAMTFSAKPDSGYSGSFKKTYKITGSELAELTSVSVKQNAGDNRVIYEDSGAVRLEKPVPYTREGVKPAGQLCLVNRETGTVLKEGRDYKVSYKNNSAVTAGKVIAADKKPVVVIVGKGSYTGTLSVYFEIGSGRIVPQDIAVSTMALNTKNGYQYMPKVKIMDGRKALRSGADKDYVVTYRNNDQTNVTRYINGETDAKEPEAVISVSSASSYHLTNAAGETVPEICVPLKLYRQALKKSELYVIVDEPVYDGCQLKPQGDSVRVYLGDSNSVKAAYRSKEKQDTVLTAQDGQYRLTRLTEGTDYTLGYGANIAAGTNKGILTITGNSSQYGGSVTIKFTILRRNVYKSGQDQVRDSREKPCLYPAALGTAAFQ